MLAGDVGSGETDKHMRAADLLPILFISVIEVLRDDILGKRR